MIRLAVLLLLVTAHRQVVLSNLMMPGSGTGSGMGGPLEPNSTSSFQSTLSSTAFSSDTRTPIHSTAGTTQSSVVTTTSLLSSSTRSIDGVSVGATPTSLSTVTSSILLPEDSITPTISTSLVEVQRSSITSTIASSTPLTRVQSSPVITTTVFSTSLMRVQSSTISSAGMTSISQEGIQSTSLITASPDSAVVSPTLSTVLASSVADTASSLSAARSTGVSESVTSSVLLTSTPVTAMTIPSSTTAAPPTSILDQIVNFFTMSDAGLLGGIFGGGGVILILILIIICSGCGCICSKMRKKKRQQRSYSIHDTGLTVTNPAATSSNGTVRYRQSMLTSNLSLRNAEAAHYELNQNLPEPDEGYLEHQTWETSIDEFVDEVPVRMEEVHDHSQARQLSIIDDDLFQERTLPELTPINSQLFASTSLHQGLSVDEGSASEVPHRLSLSGEFPRLPGGSPSLRHVTRMGRSIENEDTKSAQGSRLSIPGSKTSIQGSRPSVFSSQASFLQSGSRSQMFSPILNDPMPPGTGNQRDDDTFSLPLSGRTTSPLLQQSSLNSSIEVPTRDEPASHAPLHATSHDLGSGVKDFASMTCIPNHSAFSADTPTNKASTEHKPENLTESGSGRRRSVTNCDLSALTNISGRKSSSTSEPGETSETKSPEKPVEEATKSKSKMSRLEMLTSLRASMRKAAMRMSFRGKKKKENTILTNDSAISEQEATPTRDKSARRHSDNAEPTSPGDTKGRQRTQSDFPQLSQPGPYYQPIISPYHQQLSQSYGFPHPPVPVSLDNPFGRGVPHPSSEYSTRYPGMVTPDYSDLTTPEHGRYGNQNGASTPETFLQHDDSTSDDFPQSTSPNEFQRATSPTVSNDGRSPEPDRFPNTSLTSDPYRVHSPLGYSGKPLPTLHERYNFNGYPDDLPSVDMFSAVPPYNSDAFTSPRRRGEPSEFPPGMGGLYPPHPMHGGYPGGGMPNGYPGPRGDYFEGSRNFDHSYDRGDDPVYKRKNSYDRTGEPYHPRQGSYEQAPGDFPYPRQHHHPRRGSRDYEHDGYTSHSTHRDSRRQSGLSEAGSDLSASRTRVSWNMEVIEHIRTPSDGSDFDLNQL